MLQNFLRMICDANGVPLAAVICKRIFPRTDSDDIAFGLQYSEYASRDDGPLTARHLTKTPHTKSWRRQDPLTCSTWLLVIKSRPSSRDVFAPITSSIYRSSGSIRPLIDVVLTFHLKCSCLGMTTLPPPSAPLKNDWGRQHLRQISGTGGMRTISPSIFSSTQW